MCITFLFTNIHNPNCPYKLILINNRDEYYARLTVEAELKCLGNLKTINGTDIDAHEHGTWVGLSQFGETIRIGNILNVTGETVKQNARGRGPIVLDFIKSKDSITVFNTKLKSAFDDFNGFNFLSIELSSADVKVFNACNIDRRIHGMSLGYNGISNSPFRLPYLKVINGQSSFQKLVESQCGNNKENFVNSLLNFLKCESKHLPCPELSKRRPRDAEVFSSIHVKYPEAHYGTRNRSVILIDHFHNVDYVEERMVNEDPNNPIWERKILKIEGNVKPRGMFGYFLGFTKLIGRLKSML